MQWKSEDVDVEAINNGQQITVNTKMVPELINPLVQLLMYKKEA